MNVTAALPARVQQDCVEAAIQAPSIHNTQPWRIGLHPGSIDIVPDLSRKLEVIDPNARALYISCGAAVGNVRAALAANGRHSEAEFIPDSHAGTYIATVSATGTRRVTGDDLRRYAAVRRRHTSREPFENRLLTEGIQRMLVEAAAHEHAWLRILDEDERDAFLSVVRTAEVRQRRSPAYRAELGAWTSDRSEMRDDGVPAAAFGAWSVMEAVPLRDFAIAHPVARKAKRFEFEPTVAMLSTDGDGRADWLRAGMALERVWLDATSGGLAMCPMTQALEMPDLRRLLAQRSPLAVPQVLFRIGFGFPGPASPRRPADDVLLESF
jgi:nitroreductase